MKQIKFIQITVVQFVIFFVLYGCGCMKASKSGINRPEEDVESETYENEYSLNETEIMKKLMNDEVTTQVSLSIILSPFF